MSSTYLYTEKDVGGAQYERRYWLMLAMSLVALILVMPVAALTASPASHNFNHHEEVETYSLTLHNDELQTLVLSLTPTGPLSSLIDVQETITLAPTESKEVQVSISSVPNPTPGVIESGILIEAISSSAGTVSAQSALLHVIRLRTPNEGTFLSATLLQSAPKQNEPLYLTLSIANTGTERIETIDVDVTVSGAQNHSLKAATTSLLPGQTRDLVVTFTPKTTGQYVFDVLIWYDEKESKLTGTATIGTFAVAITNITLGEFRLGDPFRVSTTVRNDWGESLPVTIIIDAVQANTTKQTGRSTGILLRALQERSVPVFIESKGLVPGPAALHINVLYGGESISRVHPITIGVDSLSPSTSDANISWPARVVVLLLAIGLLLVVVLEVRKLLRKE